MRKFFSLLAGLALSAALLILPASAAELPFSDVTADDWYSDSVAYVYENGLFLGTSETSFSPDATLSRAMLVTVLYRQAAPDTQTFDETPFTDTDALSEEFQTAIRWAYANNIVSGTSETTFNPDDAITREQLCTIIVNYMREYLELDLDAYLTELTFADRESISDWAADAVCIAANLGIVNGRADGDAYVFDPTASATRAEAAKVISVEYEAASAIQAGGTVETTGTGTSTGGTTTTTTYQITVDSSENGSIASSHSSAASGTTITLTATPDDGYVLDSVSVTDNDSAISLTKADENQYTFTMPADAVTGSATFAVDDYDADEAAAIAGYIETMLDNYETYISLGNLTDDDVKACADLLLGTMESALDDYNNGARLTRSYVTETYGSEISEFKSLYSALDSDQKTAFQTCVLYLETLRHLEAICDFFGVDYSSIS
ncbi:MAG: S-layer homology domain-containing protein [Oscillospiraceae bacterium]|nr:S-layer homology domain-containing protein [Oscillospiraceae bacterium]